MEEWRDIQGYEGLYQVSTQGNVVSYKRNIDGKILKPGKDRYGYSIVVLQHFKDPKTQHIHRLVAKTFLKNPNNYLEVNHIDGVKTHNDVNNLEWCTREYNRKHAVQLGLYKGMKGEKNPQSKLSEDNVKEILQLRFKEKWTYTKIANRFNVHCKHVQHICRGESWNHIS